MARWILGGVGIALCIAIGFITYGFLAPLKVHFVTQIEAELQAVIVDEATVPFVGLALSGGGARAAVFAAAGMQALEEKGLLEHVTHVSSVSGGGFTAAYWALNPMPYSETNAYFEGMRAAAAHDYQTDIYWNQVFSPSRILSPSRRLLSLQDALQATGNYINSAGEDATIGDLPYDRAYFFNAVSYDTGRRFVISNHALPDPGEDNASRLPPRIRAVSFSSPAFQRPTPSNFPVSLAVATSAAFPPYVGPMSIQINDADNHPFQYWRLGDGGLLENAGVETLREAIYAGSATTSATIYSFDGGLRLNPDLTRSDISVFSVDIVQLVDVILTYAGGHREALYDALDAANGMDITTHTFSYLDIEGMLEGLDPYSEDYRKWTSWDDKIWEALTKVERAVAARPVDRLQDIPTGYSITDADSRLIAEAASFLVNHSLP